MTFSILAKELKAALRRSFKVGTEKRSRKAAKLALLANVGGPRP